MNESWAKIEAVSYANFLETSLIVRWTHLDALCMFEKFQLHVHEFPHWMEWGLAM